MIMELFFFAIVLTNTRRSALTWYYFPPFQSRTYAYTHTHPHHLLSSSKPKLRSD